MFAFSFAFVRALVRDPVRYRCGLHVGFRRGLPQTAGGRRRTTRGLRRYSDGNWAAACRTIALGVRGAGLTREVIEARDPFEKAIESLRSR